MRQRRSIFDAFAAMAMAGAALVARAAALGEGVGRIERRIWPLMRVRETASSALTPRFFIARWARDAENPSDV